MTGETEDLIDVMEAETETTAELPEADNDADEAEGDEADIDEPDTDEDGEDEDEEAEDDADQSAA